MAGIGILDKIGKQNSRLWERTSFISELIISYEDGRKESIIDEKNWSYNYGPILSSSIYNGETVDMNLKNSKWSFPGHKNKNSKKLKLRAVIRVL